MIRLDTTTRKLQAVLSSAITTNQLPITVSYSDQTASTYLGASNVVNTNSTTAVEVVTSPASGAVRDIDYLSIMNTDTVAAVVTFSYNDNATLYSIIKVSLAVGDKLEYVHGSGWKTTDLAGRTKIPVGTGGGGGLTLPVDDTTAIVMGDIDNTKQLRFEVDGFTSATTRVLTPPDADAVIVGTDTTQTLTNKTIDGTTNDISNVSLVTDVTGNLPVTNLNSGTGASATTFWRGDGTWDTPAGGTTSDSFKTIAVAGQSDIVATSPTDTLTLVAGSNITLTTNAGTDTLTIASSGGGGGGSAGLQDIFMLMGA